MKYVVLLSALVVVLFVVGAKITGHHKSHGAPAPELAGNGTPDADSLSSVSIKVASGK